MGLKFSSFSIRGIDVSSYNGTIDWGKVNCNFVGIRAGYGRTIDTKFLTNWKNAKGKVKRFPYWYMDYYSNHNSGSAAYGKSDADWGKEQAETLWAALKSDPEGIVFLDIENGNSSYAPAITTVASRAQAIARGFLERLDALNGMKNGIYCSLSMLNWFTSWFKSRPVWVAWYNELQTSASVLKAVSGSGWTGKCFMWQYASDGDLNDDGTADGLAMGMQYPFLDLNAWLGTSADYTIFFTKQNPVEEPISLYKVKVLIDHLSIRSGAGDLYPRLRSADYQGIYSIYEEKNGYGRISPTISEWMRISTSFVKRVDETVEDVTDAVKLARLWAAHPELR